MRAFDALLFSSLWVAAAAAALSAAAGRALGAPAGTGPLLIAFGGTLAIYNLDRLRDLPRDRGGAGAERVRRSTPGGVDCALRGRRGARRRRGLARRRAHLAAPRDGAPARPRPPAPEARLERQGALRDDRVGRDRRRGAGARRARETRETAWAAALVGLAIFGNAIASNVRDREAAAAVFGGDAALRVARTAAAVATFAAFFAPPALRPLGWVGIATLAALLGYRPGERYGLAVVDGALLLGALTALVSGPR